MPHAKAATRAQGAEPLATGIGNTRKSGDKAMRHFSSAVAQGTSGTGHQGPPALPEGPWCPIPDSRLAGGMPSDSGRSEQASVETGRQSAADTDCEGPARGPEGRRELK